LTKAESPKPAESLGGDFANLVSHLANGYKENFK